MKKGAGVFCFKYVFSFFLFLLFANASLAGDSTKIKPRFLIGLDSYHAFVADDAVHVGGGFVGVGIGERWRIGAGIYGLAKRTSYPDFSFGPRDSLKASFGFSYADYFVEYTFLKWRRWSLSVPVQLGAGNADVSFVSADTTFRGNYQRLISVCVVELMTRYKILRWCGLGGGVGYRTGFTRDKNFRQRLYSPIWEFHFDIYLGELWRMIFPPEEKS